MRRRCYLAQVTARCLLLAALSMPLLAAAGDAPVGLQAAVVFGDYTPLSSSAELARRLLSPLNAWRLQQASARPGQALRAQPIDLAHESFAVYVPPGAPPPHGYALLVFVPPWETATVPPRWMPVLDRHGTIYVSAARSGNGADVLDRREPLALLAAYNIMRRYPVDPQRVYIGGFSGGSRVALHIALGYPDVFRGALLDAGSDPIGTPQIPLPSPERFGQFQESTRLVYLTGGQDDFHLDEDMRSRQSMQLWCMFNLDTVAMPWAGHDLADPAGLDHALQRLADPPHPDSGKLVDCRAGIERKLDAQLQRAQQLIADGRLADARTLLEAIDARYGGLAAPRSVELLEKTVAQH
jgi:pimeloyl-ACP methyl ester carboxylesterase